MKSLLLIPALLLAAPAAFAGELLPNLYAREYCNLRSLGVNAQEARAAAVDASYLDNGKTEPKVTINGTQYDASVVRAFQAVSDRCPQYL